MGIETGEPSGHYPRQQENAHLVNSPCIRVLHGLLDGIPNVIYLEEARDIGRDGHGEDGKEVMGENLNDWRGKLKLTFRL